MKDRYKAVILGIECEVCGYDDEGTLLLANGDRFKAVPIGIEAGTFRSYTLRTVSRLTFSGGQWLMDGEPFDTWFSRQYPSPSTSENQTRFFTALTLREVLAEDRHEYLNEDHPLPSELQKKATAVAWVEERFEDYPEQKRSPNEKPVRVELGGEVIVTEESPHAKAFKPIFLSSFYRILSWHEATPAFVNPSRPPGGLEVGSQSEFTHDVFISYSSRDKAVVRPIAERLRRDGLRVWFDEWEIKPGDSVPARIEEGLEHSRLLLLCTSANAIGSDWAKLEAETFRFRDPLNKGRRFIPLRLDDAPIKQSLAQFLYIDWRPTADREQEYAKLLEACRHPATWPNSKTPIEGEPSTLGRLRGVAKTAGQEWKRIQVDFESQARTYPKLRLEVLCVGHEEAIPASGSGQPNHMINLWQYFGSGDEARKRLASPEFTKFGVMGAEVSAYGMLLGPETNLFCRMASRAGSLLPDNIDDTILVNVRKHYDKSAGAGGSIVVANRNPLAKWLNLVLMATVHAFPGRLESGKLSIDPFEFSTPWAVTGLHRSGRLLGFSMMSFKFSFLRPAHSCKLWGR